MIGRSGRLHHTRRDQWFSGAGGPRVGVIVGMSDRGPQISTWSRLELIKAAAGEALSDKVITTASVSDRAESLFPVACEL